MAVFGKQTRLAAALALGASAGIVGSTHAAYTAQNPNGSSGITTEDVLEEIYGGDFAPIGNDYTNGTVTVTRIEDTGGTPGTLDLLGADTTTNDQVWSDGIANVAARARWARFNQKFGYFDGASGGTYNNLFDVVGGGDSPSDGFAVSGSASFDFTTLSPAEWRWARSGPASSDVLEDDTYTSLNTDNPNDKDHLLSFFVTGLTGPEYAGKSTWLLFWEDKPVGQGTLGDEDYQDLVVEVIAEEADRTDEIDTPPVPEPVTATLGMLGLGGLALAASRRR